MCKRNVFYMVFITRFLPLLLLRELYVYIVEYIMRCDGVCVRFVFHPDCDNVCCSCCCCRCFFSLFIIPNYLMAFNSYTVLLLWILPFLFILNGNIFRRPEQSLETELKLFIDSFCHQFFSEGLTALSLFSFSREREKIFPSHVHRESFLRRFLSTAT